MNDLIEFLRACDDRLLPVIEYAERCEAAFGADENQFAAGASYAANEMLRILAQPYAERPGFDPAWQS
jgi:hypothetical protein